MHYSWLNYIITICFEKCEFNCLFSFQILEIVMAKIENSQQDRMMYFPVSAISAWIFFANIKLSFFK